MHVHEPLFAMLAGVFALSSIVMLWRGLKSLGQSGREQGFGLPFVLLALTEAVLAAAMTLRSLEPGPPSLRTLLLASFGAGVFAAVVVSSVIQSSVIQSWVFLRQSRGERAEALGRGRNRRAV